MTYVHQAWPSWRYGPNGEAEIFQSEDEVPEGWLDHPAKFKTQGEKPAAPVTGDGTGDADAEAKVNDLINNFSQAELAGMLSAMREVDDTLEFAPNWPKLRLATLIVNNGGPLEN